MNTARLLPLFNTRRWYLLTSLLLCTAVCATSFAIEDQPGFYAGGKFHKLTLSENEWVLKFDQPGQRAALEQRTRASFSGIVQDVPWMGRNDRYAILKSASVNTAKSLRAQPSTDYSSINPVYRLEEADIPMLSTGEIVVRLRDNVSEEARDSMFADYQVVIIKKVDGLRNTYIVKPTGNADGDLAIHTANAMYEDDRTIYSHVDWLCPIDLRASSFRDMQWYLDDPEDLGYGNINVKEAFDRTFGEGVIVGQLDDACDVLHEDLVPSYIGISHNVADNSQTETAAQPRYSGERHGTATMGIITAISYFTDNSGVTGVALASDFTASGGLTIATQSQIASAYTFARAQNVDVHNNSWGFGSGVPIPDVVANAIDAAFNEGRGGLGMVLCFASGNGRGMADSDEAGIEVEAGEDLATLDSVIGVGASTPEDILASYSDYGSEIDVLAPSNSNLATDSDLPKVVTTDNTDSTLGAIEPGYNNAGFTDDDTSDLADPNYTQSFGGTSAAAAMVTGTAALILSLDSDLTAPMVRRTIEHTCDKIDPDNAQYNGITSRSLFYGYGRLNAGAAVEAIHDRTYWPERVADVEVEGNTIYWKQNDDIRTVGNTNFGALAETVSVLVVQSDSSFSWRPTDGIVYALGQNVTADIEVVANLDTEQYTFDLSGGTKYFGVYSVATGSRVSPVYGFGVSVTSDGDVLDSGALPASSPDDNLPSGTTKPSVTIDVSPLSGSSPLTVKFVGNAQSETEIASYLWDFGDGQTVSSRSTSHTYVVTSGTRRFFPTFTVTDVDGNFSRRAVAVDVSAEDDDTPSSTSPTVTISVTDPSNIDSDISSGEAPLSVILTAEVTGLTSVELANLSVTWDLGDGNTATSLSASHTYRIAGRFPISVNITYGESGSKTLSTTRFIDVTGDTSSPSPTPTATANPGTGTTTCGVGMILPFWGLALMMCWRRLVRIH